MLTTRKTATSGIRIFCATKPVTVPVVRMSPHDNNVSVASSIEARVSNFPPPTQGARSSYFNDHAQPRRSRCDPASAEMAKLHLPACETDVTRAPAISS
jgi:hypothetical protein